MTWPQINEMFLNLEFTVLNIICSKARCHQEKHSPAAPLTMIGGERRYRGTTHGNFSRDMEPFFGWELLVLLWNKAPLGLEVEVNMAWFHKVSYTFFVRKAASGHCVMRLQISLCFVFLTGGHWSMTPNLNWNVPMHRGAVFRWISPSNSAYCGQVLHSFILLEYLCLLYLGCTVVINLLKHEWINWQIRRTALSPSVNKLN